MLQKFTKYLLTIVLLILLQSCIRTKVIDIPSPCVGGIGSPCDVRVPVNTWIENERI